MAVYVLRRIIATTEAGYQLSEKESEDLMKTTYALASTGLGLMITGIVLWVLSEDRADLTRQVLPPVGPATTVAGGSR